MVKCKRCNVNIKDNTNICPLCECILDDAQQLEGVRQEDRGNGYPRIYYKKHGMKFVSNILLASFFAATIILVLLNQILYAGKWWCITPVAAMLYAYLIFRTVFVSIAGYRLKIFQSIVMTLGLLLIIDIATNLHGWSVNFIVPSVVLVIDLVSIVLMISNLKNWESYLIMQIIALGLSLILPILWLWGIITNPILAFVSIAVATLTFVGTLIVGDFTAIGELKRRFHIR